MNATRDRFASRYSEPLLPADAAALAARRRTRGEPGATPAEAFALGGTVITPDEVFAPGWVLIDHGQIVSVGATKPRDALTLDTNGVILPGLVDLHGHPEWNIFAAWEPPHEYPNRTVWRTSDEYQTLIKDPWYGLTDDGNNQSRLQLLCRYADIRALIGGTTAVQGASGKYPAATTIVRHVDLAPFGEANAASLVDPLARGDPTERTQISAGIAAGTITAFYAHLAEGIDTTSRAELQALIDFKLLTAATVIIHGTALTDRQLGFVHEAGAKLVWSPQSNLRLYGQTTQAATARVLGIPLALGADWLPSGSVSLFAEMQVARRMLARQAAPITALALVHMVTAGGAKIAGLEPFLGRLDAGRPADILVLERRQEDPYESVCQANRGAVELVMIAGRLLYGRDEWFSALAPQSDVQGRLHLHATGELVWAWGKQMRLDIAAPATLNEPALPGLKAMRTELVSLFPRVGPIFA